MDDKVLFFNEEGSFLTFKLSLKHSPSIEKYKQIIEDHYGLVNDSNTIGDYDIVLVDGDSDDSWKDAKAVFNINYVTECLKQGKLLDVSLFRQGLKHCRRRLSPSGENGCNRESEVVDGFNYMDIVYHMDYTWQTIPRKFLKSQQLSSTVAPTSSTRSRRKSPIPSSSKEETPSKPLSGKRKRETAESADERVDRLMESDSDEDFGASPINKKSRMPFTYKEKKDILDYIFKKDQFELLKGNLFWKKMEKANVCPIRTWQSLKNHFNRALSLELGSFDLPKSKVVRLQKIYFKNQRK